MDTDIDLHSREIQRQYLDFLDDENDSQIYSKRVKELINRAGYRLVVNINHLRQKMPDRAKCLIKDANGELLAFQRALRDYVASVDPTFSKNTEELFIGLEGSFGSHHVTPRALSARHLGHMTCVDGIVTKLSVVHPKIVRSVHYCPATQKSLQRRYTDLTSLDPFPSSSVYPTKDEDGNLLQTEYGLSVYRDHQTFSVQEMPEKAPAGQLPRSVDIIADNDLVDRCKPGDRVQVVGIYRCLPGKKNGFTSGTFRTVLLANHISPLDKNSEPDVNATDVARIRRLSKKPQVFNLLARSIAPSIHGHEYVKKAILCQLLGGKELKLGNGSRIRGLSMVGRCSDINILLIGDPSVAKSQMLRYVLGTAPRAVATTGRGSSGVGLTAAVVTDHETGERQLEAGAMVLADRGVVCIDEFDKMSDIDRTAIHEVMEQGRVTIAKAGIHAQLNARCSVLAAANPVYGRYDQYKPPMENIGMQDSLLSRFDLLFVLLDKMDTEEDRRIAEHVLKMHQYRAPGERDGQVLSLADQSDMVAVGQKVSDAPDGTAAHGDDDEAAIFAKFEQLLVPQGLSGRERAQAKILNTEFIRKYIHVAQALRPTLTSDAADLIAKEYAELRNADRSEENVCKTQPITARSLETLVRLSTAYAKARLSKAVSMEDAQQAVDLVQFAYFKKVLKRERAHRADESDEEDVEDLEAEAALDAATQQSDDERRDASQRDRPRKRRQRPADSADEPPASGSASQLSPSPPAQKRRLLRKSDDPFEFAGSDDEGDTDGRRRGRRSPLHEQQNLQSAACTGADSQRLSEFQKGLDRLFSQQNSGAGALVLNMAAVRQHMSSADFTEQEIQACLRRMSELNQVMQSGDTLFRI